MIRQNKNNPEIDHLQQEVIAGIRTTAETIRSLGVMASQGASELEARAREQRESWEEYQERSKANEAIATKAMTDFIAALPQVKWKKGSGYDKYSGPELPAETLAEARITEASVWWVDVSEWGSVYGQYVPAFCVGERLVESNDKKSDGLISMLLAPAQGSGLEGSLIMVDTSSVGRDRAEELSIARLADPVDSREELLVYKDKLEDESYAARYPGYIERTYDSMRRQTKIRVLDRKRSAKLYSVPADDKDNERFFKKLDKSLMEDGLRTGHPATLKISPDLLASYEVVLYAHRLAALFGVEAEHEKLTTKLSGLADQV